MTKNKTQKLKQEKAITLIALVLTIIVLLILAGVTLLTLTGENGLMKKVASSVNKSKEAQAEEELNLAILQMQTDELGNLNNAKIVDEENGLKIY